MKCNECKYSAVNFDNWSFVWVANCWKLGTSINISEYQECKGVTPIWDKDLGRSNDYCPYHNDGPCEPCHPKLKPNCTIESQTACPLT